MSSEVHLNQLFEADFSGRVREGDTGDEQVKSLLVNLYFKRREEHWMMAKSVRLTRMQLGGIRWKSVGGSE